MKHMYYLTIALLVTLCVSGAAATSDAERALRGNVHNTQVSRFANDEATDLTVSRGAGHNLRGRTLKKDKDEDKNEDDGGGLTAGSLVTCADVTTVMNCSVPLYEMEWCQLSGDVQNAAIALGYTEAIWDSNEEPNAFGDYEEVYWEELDVAVRKNFEKIGYEESTYEDHFEDFWFRDLPSEALKDAAMTLGFAEEVWDSDGVSTTGVDEKLWNELSAKEKEAAEELGYNCYLWDYEEEE